MISRVQRLLVPALLLVAMCCLAACSSGGGGPADAEFTPSASAPAAGLVRLDGANVDAQTVRVDVIIDGPLVAPGLYSFAFDLLLSDPDAAQYVPGSAVLGDALVPSAGQGLGIAVSQPPDNRVVVGVVMALVDVSLSHDVSFLGLQIPCAVNVDIADCRRSSCQGRQQAGCNHA